MFYTLNQFAFTNIPCLYEAPLLTHFSLLTGRWRPHHGVPPDVPIEEHQWCLGLHQWHVQGCPAQLRLTSSQPGTHAVSSSLLFQTLFTLLQMFQISYTNEQDQGGGGGSVLLLPRYCAWCLDARLATSDRRRLCCTSACLGKTSNAKGCLFSFFPYLLTSCSSNPKKWRRKQLPHHPDIDLFRCFNASWYNKTTKIFLTKKKKRKEKKKEREEGRKKKRKEIVTQALLIRTSHSA